MAIALVIMIVGASVIGVIAYADITTSITKDDYEEYHQGCDELAGQTRMVDGGLGMEEMTLNQTHVEECKNTTYEEYRQGRREAMQSTPLNLKQWALYSGAGGVFIAIGGFLLKRQFLTK